MNLSWKRWLALLLTVVMLAGMVPTNAIHIHAAGAVETSTEPTSGWYGDTYAYLDIHNSVNVTDCSAWFAAFADYKNPVILKTEPALGGIIPGTETKWNDKVVQAVASNATWALYDSNGEKVTDTISKAGTYKLKVGATMAGTTYGDVEVGSFTVRIFDVLTINRTKDETTTKTFAKVYRTETVDVTVDAVDNYEVEVKLDGVTQTVANEKCTVGPLTKDATLTIGYSQDTDSTVTVVGHTDYIDATVASVVTAGSTVPVSITPKAGYYINSVTIDNGATLDNVAYAANGTYSAQFIAATTKKAYTITVDAKPILSLKDDAIAYNENMSVEQILQAVFAIVDSANSAPTVDAYTDLAVLFEYESGWGNPEWLDLNADNRSKFGPSSAKVKVMYKGSENNQYPATTADNTAYITLTLDENRTTATPELNANPEVTMNGYYEASDLDVTAQAALKQAILDAVVKSMDHDFGGDANNITITAYDGEGTIKGWYDIFNGAANFFTGTETIKIKWTGSTTYQDYETDEIEVTVKDSRSTTAISASNINFTADTAEQVTATAVKNALNGSVTVTDTYNTGVTSVDWNQVVVTLGEYTFPAHGDVVKEEKTTLTATLTLTGTANYQGSSTTVTVTVINPAYNPTVTLNGNGIVNLKLYSDAACQNEVTELTNLAANTYYVKVVSVTEGYDINNVTVTGATATGTDGVYSIVVEATAGEPANTYTVSATAEKLNYTVSFGGLAGEQTVAHGGVATKPATDPSKEGHKFLYWELNGAEYDFSTPVTGNIVLTAKWEKLSYTIKWYVDGKLHKTDTFEFGAAVVTPTISDKEGHGFAWNSTIPATMPAEDLEIYGVYTAGKYTVTWIVDGTKTTTTYSYGDAIEAPTDPTKEGHTFSGWSPSVAATMPAQNVEYTATWTVNKYTVTWNVDGAETTKTYSYGETIETPDDPTKEGHTFAGWSPAVAATMPAQDVEYTATWTINTYTIKFVDENGNLIGEEQTVEYSQMPKAPTAPDKADTVEWDYSFNGWDSNVVAATENKTYKATYSAVKQKYTITFKNWNGEELWSGAVEYGTVPTEPSVTAPDNHTFTGWDSTVIAVSGPKIYTATYALVANDGTIKLNGGTWTGVDNNMHIKVLTEAGLPTTGYTVCWNGMDLPMSTFEQGLNNATLMGSVGKYLTFTIESQTTGLKKDVSMFVEDARKPATINDMTQKDFGKFDKQSEFEAAVKDKITASWTDYDGNSGSVSATFINITFTQTGKTTNTNGETVYTYSAAAKVNIGENWLASENSVTFEDLTWTVNQYTVTWVDGNGEKLYSEMVDYGATPEYSGDTPTKNPTVSTTYTFTGWGTISPVSGNATYTAQFSESARIYQIHWDTNGDGTVDKTGDVAYGETPVAPTPATIENKSFAGWDMNGDKKEDAVSAVSGEVTYTALYSDDTIYSVTFMVDGVQYGDVQYINVTKNPNTVVVNPGNPDKDYAIFNGWDTDIIGKTPDGNVVVNATWNTNDKNNNNISDENETANITVNITGNGSVKLEKINTGDRIVITDKGNNTWTIIYDSTTGGARDVKVTATPAATGSESVKNYVDSARETITLGNIESIDVIFGEHSIPVVTNPSIVVNGETADSKLADVTKKSVLEAVLGRTVDDAELAQYEVKVMVNVAGYNGYYDIWALIDQFSGKDDTISQGILSALKGAFNTAIDVGGSETFEITWLAHDQFPEVKGEYEVQLLEERKPTTVTHKDGVTYTATALNDALLEKIRENLTSNTTINSLSYQDPDQLLTPGTTVDVNVVVYVQETATLYGASHTITVKVEVPTGDIDIKIPTAATIYFNTGMTGTDKVALLRQEIPYTSYVAGTDILATDVEEKDFKIQYLASTARNVPYTINIKQLDLGLAGNFLPETLEVQIPVDAMWLDLATTGNDFPVYEAPSNDLIRDILLNDLIPNYADDYLAGTLDTEGLKDKASELLAKHPDIANYYKYMGAHQFGEMENETIRYVVETQYGSKETNECVLSMVDERSETEIKLNSGVAVTYNGYTEAELLALILDGVYADGQKIDGASVEFVTDVTGLPAADASEVTVKFAGNEDYKPSEATVAIQINKATVNVSVDNRLFKWQEGKFYIIDDVVSTTPAGVQTINFIAGLNISNVNLNDGMKGFVAQVQLMLPEELQSLLASADALLQSAGLDVSFANGASMKLSELQAAVEALDDLFAGSEYEEYFRVLLNMLESLPTETADIEIIIGGEVPTDIGAYVVGAISADANYTTDFGVGAIAIYPDGTKVDLAWNQNDENYIITNTLLSNGTFDTGAHATKVYDDSYTLEEATAQVGEIFLGVDIDGNITFEMDQSKLNVGAYVEIAMIVNFGNEMLYSEPLVRPIVVVAETLDVDFVDDTGAVNNERHYEFFNIPQNGMEGNLLITYKQDGEGHTAGEKFVCPDGSTVSVQYYYVGVQTNGMPYASQEAPVHAGAYTITAVVVVRDSTDYITHAGQGVGALVIEPSESTINVENEAIKWDGQEHTVNGFVDANSVNVPGLKPDTTIISAGISADLDADIGLSAIKGNVNVDMPGWMDDLLKKLELLEAGYTDEGITAEVFLSYVEKVQTELADLGVEIDAFNEIVDVIKQLPGKTVLTFHDNIGYKDVGVYLVVGIVTDSDHYPSADAGVMVIYPDGQKVELQFNKTWDDNNVFTWQYLQSYDLNAKAYELGTNVEIPEATDKVINLFVGFADHGELEFTSNKAELDNGVYAQVAFVLDLSNSPYYAEPISREVIIVPNNADIDFLDENGDINNERHFEFNAQSHAMNAIQVTLVDGTVLKLTAEDSRVAIFYVGVQSNGVPYASAEAPVHAGVYEVTAQFTGRDDQNRVTDLGVGFGALVIEPSKSDTTVDNKSVKWDDKEHKIADMIHASSVNVPGLIPDTTVISAGLHANLDQLSGLSAINGTVNIDLPVWMDELLEQLNILEAGYADGISVEVFLNYADRIREALVKLEVDTESFDEVVSIIEQMPITTNLTFKDDIGYTNPGAYLVLAVVTDSDHYPSAGAGIMVITPDATKVELQFEEDWNGNDIYTWYALKNMNLDAKAYLDGAYCEEADKKVVNLYFGFTDNGRFLLEAVAYGEHIKDVPEFDNGLYTQLALVNDFGNIMYYAEPISRTFAIVPTPAIIEFVDETGNVNADRHFVFNNKPHAMDVRITVAGVELTDLTGLTLNYVGVQTNGELYNSTLAPTHAGVYTVTATYTDRDEQNRLVTLGVAVGAMIIEPAESEIDVDNVTHEYDGNAVNIGDMVNPWSAAGVDPDTTVITAGIKTNGTFSENLLDAIENDVNIDLPAWADELLAKVDGVQDGITVQGLIHAIEKAEAKLEQLAAEVGVDYTTGVFDALVGALEQLPANYTVTFQDAPAYKEVGAYLVIGVVTDSDHYPALDAGILVIYPDVDKADLHWVYEDSNNIFTLDTLAAVDLGAYATVNGAASDAVPFEVLFLGVNAQTMEIVLTKHQDDLNVGTYTEIAYVLDVDSQMYVAAPIVRNVLIVHNIYEVQAESATYIYDGAPKAIAPITVLDQSKQDITGKGKLYVTYMGITAGIDGYMSSNAPVNAGVYTVVITFVTYDENGNPTGAGSKIVSLTIERANPDFYLEDTEFTYDGIGKMIKLQNAQKVDYILVVRTENGVNLILSDGLSGLADFLGDDIYDLTGLKERIEKAVEAVAGLDLSSEFVDKLLETIELVNDNAIYKITVNGENPGDAGTYAAYATSVPTANYKMEVSEGTLVINPAEITAEDVALNGALTYNGTEQTQQITVTEGVTYTVTGNKATDASEYTLTVTGTGNYTGSVDVEWSIAEKAITAEDIALNGALTYNGTEQTQQITVTEGVTYTVTGNKATDASEYTLTVTGTGNYTGTVEVEWSIAAAEITSVEVTSDHVYNDAEQTVTLVVKSGDLVLTADDYAVDGNKATNAGEYIVTVTGTGNFAGEATDSWTIQKANIVIMVDNKLIKYNEELPELTFTVDMAASKGSVAVDKLAISLRTEPEQNSAGQYLPGEYVIYGAAEDTDNWTIVITNGILTVEKGEAICWNTKTGEFFTDVSDALDKANRESGPETIQMLRDATGENGKKEILVVVRTNTTLDLNGYTLEADYVVGFAGSQVFDSVGDGLLVSKNVRLASDNDAMPAWVETDDGEGYRFFTVVNYQKYRWQKDNSFQFISKPALGAAANDILVAEAAKNGSLTIKMRLSWTNASGNEVEQNFTMKQDDVYTVYTVDEYLIQLTVTGTANYKNLIYTTTVIESDTGVVWAGLPQPYTGAQS